MYINYKVAQNKTKVLIELSFDGFRRLSEFKNGLITQEMGDFLKDNPDYTSRFNEWMYSQCSPEGIYDVSLKIYQKLSELINNNRNIKTFIDLGCNSGDVVYTVSQMGIDAVGVDLPLIIDKIQLPIKTMALDLNRQFPIGTYDIIFCRETIEHVPDPDNFLECCKQIAHAESFLFISCPYTNRQYVGNAFHLRVLSSDQLACMVEKHGFTVLETFVEHESNVIVAQKKQNE
ncbi:MAG: class I SAM-dependent methyltransferase [Candidatus Scalindua sp.]|jgi:2-polyprenyl-3-methyl-5-hydroxy-6-metoxy-1,4-benzoquinol methylase|nr:class I SAM-dependent methyltransferase [Candidatus Scalindua sp.]